MGSDNFYKYIREFGFGSRPGVELPGETRGLLRAPAKWGSSSIGSIAIGQEVGVTPLQLVSMVSTIANGGVYMPPHVLMSPPTSALPKGPTPAAPQVPQVPMPFRPGGELPNPLPPGAHRVLSEISAAQMRKMMEGVVLFGTGKGAQLNGYSSGGKTGTAQKVDPRTHLYSKTMHVASFAGIAPVNNPVISVAVIIDTPKGPSYYGAAVSAPVFADVAQQVLEYLGVPHDIELRAAKTNGKPDKPAHEDEEHDDGNVNALFAAVNDLPADDPLRQPQPAPQEDATRAHTVANSTSADRTGPAVASSQPSQPPSPQKSATTAVVMNADKQLKVPSLIGLPMRKVIETAAVVGLEVQVMGSGTVREQAPAAGTMVQPGTRIVVRCGR
jgi:cell division protein FtsI (penicillin-binding protein 3)